jgi:CTP:molybdopterin cytidylyltransferase MocA
MKQDCPAQKVIPTLALVLAGGLGTRLRAVLADRPKSLALVAGKPFLHYVLDYLRRQGLGSGDHILSGADHTGHRRCPEAGQRRSGRVFYCTEWRYAIQCRFMCPVGTTCSCGGPGDGSFAACS